MVSGRPAGGAWLRAARRAPVYLAAALVAATPAAAQAESADEWRLEYEEWKQELSGFDRVRVASNWGDLRVRAGDGDEVYVKTAGQRHRDDPRRTAVEFVENAGGLDVTIGFAEVDDGGEPKEEWNERRRIDAAVYLPDRLAAEFRTDGGLVELRGLRNEAAIETRTGDVVVRAHGRLDAKSERGRVHAHFLTTGWAGESVIETVTGEIHLELPRGGNADVELETRGLITTDYSIEIERAPGSRLKRGRVKVGEGGATIRASSARGGIKLLASPIPAEE